MVKSPEIVEVSLVGTNMTEMIWNAADGTQSKGVMMDENGGNNETGEMERGKCERN